MAGGIDSSIYFQQQPLDIMGSVSRGLSMRDMIDQRALRQKQIAEDQAIKDAYKAGVVTGPDGKTSFNSEITASQLMGVNPQKGIEFKQQQQSQDAANWKLAKEKIDDHANFMGRGSMAIKANNGQGYNEFLAQAQARGLDTSMMPPVYGPDAQQKLDFYAGQALTAKEQMDLQNKDRDFALREKELQSKAADRKEAREDRRFQFGQKMDEKRTAAADKKNTQMFEIEDRRQNINANLSQLKSMVKNDGTWEMFGSHNQDMDRLVEQIATDMAKLMDPTSVARPSEVEQIKKSLVESGFSNRNATATDILNNFENEVERRASSAYKIRGLQPPRGRNKAQDSEALSGQSKNQNSQAPVLKGSEIEW